VGMDVLFPPDDGDRRARHAAFEPHGDHDHARFDSFERRFDGEVDPDVLIAALRAEDAVRCKGFVRTAAGVKVVQGVGPRIELSDPVVSPRPDLIGRVVVIRSIG
jgi:hypothetical protein